MMTSQISETSVLLDTASPELSLRDVERIARDVFGLAGEASELTGERDRNYHLRAGDAHYVLKVSNPAEDPQVIDFQTRALLHIAAVDPGLPVPRLRPTRTGAADWLLEGPGQAPRLVRVLSFLQGLPMHKASPSLSLQQNLGLHAARLDLALRGFFHAGAGHELMWDLKHANTLRPLLEHISNPAQRALAARVLDSFERHALPMLPGLRAQVIHNDLNPHNVLVAPDDHSRIAGIIDFGDMVHAPLINSLAVAAAYQVSETGHPLEMVAAMVAAYHQLVPLEPVELDLLFDLITTRMVLTVAISGWRAARYPENHAYILRNNLQAWARLTRCDTLDRTDAQAYLRQACRVE
ncbi:aminoglycoside phosphotransferase [Bosea thiooxidans]|uniref:Hydroxylysine kinase n=1 Tax=Bosea thiooxidans TaxID=53254 RepID=A0A0Q3T2Q7_9HYPH|nr:phosphotransferase [Bosea thiooxidans]KQK31962.1 aminoglycoside phosphotransferase [Bosea thiooxidans]SKB51684.1 Ser/Thr protein kinase RdoA involved in Cpx stress response, MazF antagonist [Bosea thiooxidans]